MFRKSLLIVLVPVSLVLLAAGTKAEDGLVERPMKFTGVGTNTSYLDPFDPNHPWVFNPDGTFDVPWKTEEAGTGTHLGEWQSTAVGYIRGRVLPGGALEWIAMWGDAEFTADNGDKLFAVYEWPEGPNFTQLTATLTIYGGTGRFENARGTLIWVGEPTGEQWLEGTDHVSVFWESAEGMIAY